jgi:hypothetical protein
MELLLGKFVQRISFGVREELLPLMEIPGVKKVLGLLCVILTSLCQSDRWGRLVQSTCGKQDIAP